MIKYVKVATDPSFQKTQRREKDHLKGRYFNVVADNAFLDGNLDVRYGQYRRTEKTLAWKYIKFTLRSWTGLSKKQTKIEKDFHAKVPEVRPEVQNGKNDEEQENLFSCA